jgi:hypothetical protein
MAPKPSAPGKLGISKASEVIGVLRFVFSVGLGINVSVAFIFDASTGTGIETGKQPVRLTETKKRNATSKPTLDLFVICPPQFWPWDQ